MNKLTKFILPIAAIMLFVSVGADAQICVYRKGEEYRLEDAIQYKGDNLAFIKFCCDELGMCTGNYAARDKYYLTHIAAMYNRCEVLKYLVDEKHIPYDKFPANMKTGEFERTKTQVMMSAANGSYECTQFLISKGASVTRKNEENHDALYFAKTSKNQSVISIVKAAWDKETRLGSYNILSPKNKTFEQKTKLLKMLAPSEVKRELTSNVVFKQSSAFKI